MLYFIPGEQGLGINNAVLRRVGLWPVIGDACVMSRGVMRGPNGLSGLVCAANTDAAVAMEAEAQTWVECAGGAFWVGYWNERKPGPGDLQRDMLVDGHIVRMQDENDWLIPCARVWGGSTRLPQVVGCAVDGSLRYDVAPKYTAFYGLAMAMWERYIADETGMFGTVEEVFDVCAAALTVNYRVSRWECSASRLVDTEILRRVAHAVIDGPTIEAVAAQKKKEDSPAVSESSNSACGDAA